MATPIPSGTSASAPPILDCFTCGVVDEYIRLANAFTQDVSAVLVAPIWAIFFSLAALWIIIHGIKMMLGQADLFGFCQEFVYVAIAAMLMVGQGPGLVSMIYSTSLSVMGGAASSVISTASITDKTGVSTPGGVSSSSSAIPNVGGMRKLVFVAEDGVGKVFGLAGDILAQRSGFNFMPIIYAILLVMPYFLLIVVFFAQVIVSIFRILVLAALSPVLMLCFGFGWGRGMAFTALRTLFSSYMVLFGATIAISVCLYGVREMSIGVYENPNEFLSFTSAKLWVAIILGWCGTAFLAEATGIANSIAGSQLTNTGAAVITGGVLASAAAVAGPLTRKFNREMDAGVDAGVDWGIGKGVAGARWMGSAFVGGGGGNLSPAGQEIMDRVKSHGPSAAAKGGN